MNPPSFQFTVLAARPAPDARFMDGSAVFEANQTAEIKIISANAASDAIVTLKSQLRIL